MIAEGFRRDFRFAARLLFKAKGFCVIASLVLALGICGVTTQLTIINSLLFRLLPFPDSDRLVTVSLRDPNGIENLLGNHDTGGAIRAYDFNDLEREQTSFDEMAAFTFVNAPVTINEVSAYYSGAAITPNFFQVLGVKPMLGREFSEADAQYRNGATVIISAELWERNFNRDPEILQRTLKIAQGEFSIIGVMPGGFHFPRAEQLWLPSGLNRLQRPLRLIVGAIGRLRPGVTREQATVELSTIARRMAGEYPDTNGAFTFVDLQPLAHALVGKPFRHMLYAMLGAVLAVLLIASFNVLNLQLARTAARIREFAVRGALGATRSRLLRLVLTESGLIALVGGSLGVLFSWWCVQLLRGVVTSNGRGSGIAPPWARFHLDGTVLLGTIAVVAVVVLVSGLAPAWFAARTNAAHAMKAGGWGVAGNRFSRLTRTLVVAQIALTTPLLCGSLLVFRSLRQQQDFDWGFPAEATVTNRFALGGAAYSTDDNRKRFHERLQQSLREDPLFIDATFTIRPPDLWTPDDRFSRRYELEGDEYRDLEQRPSLIRESVSPGYFGALNIPVRLGRDLQPSDAEPGRRVGVVNAAFVRRHFSTGNPLGARVRTFDEDSGAADEWITIVGVVPDFALSGPVDPVENNVACLFIPLGSSFGVPGPVSIVARGRGDPGILARSLNAHISRLDPNLNLYGPTEPLQNRLQSVLRVRTNLTTLFCAFGLVSVMLAAVGLYGVTALSVNQRTQEFGVRFALGATPGQVLRQVLREGSRQFLIGGSIGLVLTVILGRLGYAFVADFLYRVNPFDWFIYLTVAALLAAVTVLACLAPARWATKVDPIEALRAE